MIGHQLAHELSKTYETFATYRGSASEYLNVSSTTQNLFNVDACDEENLQRLVHQHLPNVIVNAVGIVKQRSDSKSPLACLELNAILPHKLQKLTESVNAKFIQISTDCVFSGNRGHYSEEDISDATDIYGKTKFLGEVIAPNTLTLRTSTIGLETAGKKGLIEWFLGQKGVVKGYRQAIYSGLITSEFARVLKNILEHHYDLNGLFQVGATAISKFDLLSGLAARLERRDIFLEIDDTFRCDRSLNSEKFQNAVGYKAPSWDIMLDELAENIRRRKP